MDMIGMTRFMLCICLAAGLFSSTAGWGLVIWLILSAFVAITENGIPDSRRKRFIVMSSSVGSWRISTRQRTCFSSSAWYGSNDHGRSWHNGAKDTSENAKLYGYNFDEQWDFAEKLDPDIVFVTGFNEWVAQRLTFRENEPFGFCDNCDEEYSRDFEPSAGVLGDNYYM